MQTNTWRQALPASPQTHLGEMINSMKPRPPTKELMIKNLHLLAAILAKLFPAGDAFAELPNDFKFRHGGSGTAKFELVKTKKHHPNGTVSEVYALTDTEASKSDLSEFFADLKGGFLDHLYRQIESDDQMRARAQKRPPAAGL